MLDLTAKAEVDGIKFDGVDLFLFDPHVSIDIERRRSEAAGRQDPVEGLRRRLGGRAGLAADRRRLGHGQRRRTRKNLSGRSARPAASRQKLRELGVRPYGVVRIDSACGVADWAKDPEGNTKQIAADLPRSLRRGRGFGERLAAEGEICWGGMHSWRKMVDLLEVVDRPKTLGFQADMAHTLLYTLGYNAPEDAHPAAGLRLDGPDALDEALKTLTSALRPWTIDFHVAQNDATVKGSGSHDKTGHHCLPNDPNGKLDIARHAGYWLRDDDGKLTKAFQHICWDGCMFPNEVMMKQRDLERHPAAMIAVRDAHGWNAGRTRGGEVEMSAKQKLNVGLIGYGFMGRAHSNAYRKVNNFFDLEYQPVLKAVCARDADKVKAFADKWGYESVETDWRKLIARKDIDLIDICTPEQHARRDRHRRGQGRQDDPVRKAAGDERRRKAEKMVAGRREGQSAEHGLVQLPPRARRHAGQATHRRRPARADLPLPRQVPAGLDDHRRPAARRRRACGGST